MFNFEEILPNETNLKRSEQIWSCFLIKIWFCLWLLLSSVFNSCFLHLIQAREDGLTVIQPHSLSFVNSESPSGKIIYNITVPLHPNQGKIVSEGVFERLTFLPCDFGLKTLGFSLLLYIVMFVKELIVTLSMLMSSGLEERRSGMYVDLGSDRAVLET